MQMGKVTYNLFFQSVLNMRLMLVVSSDLRQNIVFLFCLCVC